MKKTVNSNGRKAFQVKAEEVKHLQVNKELIDKISFNAGEKDKFQVLDKSFGYTKDQEE